MSEPRELSRRLLDSLTTDLTYPEVLAPRELVEQGGLGPMITAAAGVARKIERRAAVIEVELERKQPEPPKPTEALQASTPRKPGEAIRYGDVVANLPPEQE